MREFVKLIGKLDGRYTSAELFSDFLTLSCNSLSNYCDWQYFDKREKQALQIMQKYSEKELIIFRDLLVILMQKANEALEKRELVDLFNLIFMAGFSDSGKGQFFTPFPLSQFMAITTLDESQPLIKLGELSCGSGGMIIAAANQLMKRGVDYQNRLLVECADKDLRCAQMCYLQLYLYGIPAVVRNANALSGEVYEEYRTLMYLLLNKENK